MRSGKPQVLAFVMAGGEGTRLHALTADRCKPAVPFNCKHRVVDFVLSNLINSEIYSIYLLVQYKSQALIEHVRNSWVMATFIPDHFVTVVPPQMRIGRDWFQGTADAVLQNLHLLDTHRPALVAVFGADHVYRMDVRQMIDRHLAAGADVSIATLPVRSAQSPSFGIVEVDEQRWVRKFHEKPAHPPEIPGRPGYTLASMGNYIFSADVLMQELQWAGAHGESDFGTHVMPRLAQTRKVLAYDFSDNQVPGVADFEEPHYWRDVGTLDEYFHSHFDTLGPRPKFRITNAEWPIYASRETAESAQVESGRIQSSVLGNGCVITQARLDHAMLRRSVIVEAHAQLDHCIVMDRTVVGREASITRAIVDMDNHIPPGEVIGGNLARDRQRFHVTDSGIVLVPRGFFPQPKGPVLT